MNFADIVIGIAVALPICAALFIVIIIPPMVAYARTKKWDRERTLEAVNVDAETHPLVNEPDPDDETIFLDSEDEAEQNTRKAEKAAEKEAERYLTFGQKFRKEWAKAYEGRSPSKDKEERKKKEMRKLVKALTRELDRRERRRAGKAGAEVRSGEELPVYKKE